MYGRDLGKGSLYVKFVGPAPNKFELLSASAVLIRADTSCIGYLRMNEDNQ